MQLKSIAIVSCLLFWSVGSGNSESWQSQQLRRDVSSIADATQQISSNMIYQINAINNISASINNAAFSNLLGNMAMASALRHQAVVQAEVASQQEEWQEWNGMVSLLTPEQKQIVLAFNQNSDKQLLNMWVTLKGTTQTVPTGWLMPTKQRALASNAYNYWTTKATGEQYISWLYDLSPDQRESIWNVTEQSVTEKIEEFLDKQSVVEYIQLVGTLDALMRMRLWQSTSNQKIKELQNYLKPMGETYKLQTEEDFTVYANYVMNVWDSAKVQSRWKKYQKQLASR